MRPDRAKGTDSSSPRRPSRPGQQQQQHQQHSSVAPFVSSPYSSIASLQELTDQLQSVYYEIGKLEEQCASGCAKLEAQQTFSEQGWLEAFKAQCRLLDKYHDFLFLAYHHRGSSATAALPKKYKIPLRLWNKGIFKFLDQLRAFRPNSKELIFQFTIHCFSVLTMLTDPPIESRNMWREALGDVARFSMVVGQSSFMDWRRISQFWYERAMVRSPGVGRLYHHSAVVSAFRIDSLFYFCKSLTCYHPFEPARETIFSLFKSSSSADCSNAVSSYLALHNELIVNPHSQQFSDPAKLNAFLTGIEMDRTNRGTNGQDRSSDELVDRGATIAACNISALLGYGSADGVLASLLARQESNDWAHEQPIDLPPAALELACKTLETFLRLPVDDALAHLHVWLLFLCSLTKWSHVHAIVSSVHFPREQMNRLIEECMKVTLKQMSDEGMQSSKLWDHQLWQLSMTVSSSTFKQQYPHAANQSADLLARTVAATTKTSTDQVARDFKPFRRRLLPEEAALFGFSWVSKHLVSSKDFEDIEGEIVDDAFPGFEPNPLNYASRPVKIVRLAYELSFRYPKALDNLLLKYCSSRRIPPFLNDMPHFWREQSLFNDKGGNTNLWIHPPDQRENLDAHDYVDQFEDKLNDPTQWTPDLASWLDHFDILQFTIDNLDVLRTVFVPLCILQALKVLHLAEDERAIRPLQYILDSSLGNVLVVNEDRVRLNGQDAIEALNTLPDPSSDQQKTIADTNEKLLTLLSTRWNDWTQPDHVPVLLMTADIQLCHEATKMLVPVGLMTEPLTNSS